MAETQQLLDKAKSGSFNLREFMQMNQQGGTPNITQEQTPPDTGSSVNLRAMIRQAEQEQEAQGQQSYPQSRTQATVGQRMVAPDGRVLYEPAPAEMLQKPGFFESADEAAARFEQSANLPQGVLSGPTEEQIAANQQTLLDIAENYSREEFLPTATGLAGLVGGTYYGGPAGGVVGGSAGTAFGRYLNKFFGIQDPKALDYILDMSMPVIGGTVSKTGKVLAKRALPAVEKAMVRKSLAISDDLAELAARPAGKLNVDAAYDALRASNAKLPIHPVQTAVDQLPPKVQKKILKDIGFTKPHLEQALSDKTVTHLSANDVRELNSRINYLIEQGFKANANTKARDTALALQDLQKTMKSSMDQMAAAGNEGVAAIRKAGRLAETQKSFEELDSALRASRSMGAGLEESINIGGLYKRFKDMERITEKGGRSTDKLFKAYRNLQRDPERYQTFMEGLERISKYAPDGIKIDSGIAGKGAQIAGEILDTGILTNLIATKPGQIALEKIVKDTKGVLNVPMLASLGVLVRPLVTNQMPDQDPVIQKTMEKLADFQNTKKANQPQTINQSNQ